MDGRINKKDAYIIEDPGGCLLGDPNLPADYKYDFNVDVRALKQYLKNHGLRHSTEEITKMFIISE